MKREQVLLGKNNFYESDHVPIFIMVLRLLFRFNSNFNTYELDIINLLLEEILESDEDKQIINFDQFSSNLSLIERLSDSRNEKSENSEEFESFLDYAISSRYSIFKLDYNSERRFYEISELENNFIRKNLDYESFKLIKEDKNNEVDFSYEITNYEKNDISIDKDYDINIAYNENLFMNIKETYGENSNFTITYEQNSSINQKDFYESYKYELDDIDSLANEEILENNYFNIEFNTIINNHPDELIVDISIDSNNKEILIQNIDFDNKTEKFKIDSLNIQYNKNNDINLQNKFYHNSNNENFDFNFELKEVKSEVYSEKKDFESEITPCLDIDFTPERIDNKKYSLFRGGLELKVNEYDSKDSAVFGVTDTKTNSGKAYNTNANEISALIFKVLEEKGVFADFEFNNGQIYLKEVNGTRMFIEDNQNISVNNISYKVVLRDNKTKGEIKNFSLNDKLNPGDYTVDIVAEVDYGGKFFNDFDKKNNRYLENNSPDFNVMIRNDKKIRAYCIDECGFETNGKDSILNQIIKVSKHNGYDLELETMDTIANNKIRARSVTYVKDIVGTKEKYLELHPTAKEDKIGILYLVFDENNRVLGEVGYRDEGLDYVARKGLKIKPVIYELGANIKDAYVWNKVPEHPKKFYSEIFSDAKINNAV